MILCSVRSHVLITPCRVNMGFLREAELSYQENSSCFNIGPCSRFEQLQHIQQEYIRDLRVTSGRLETLQNVLFQLLPCQYFFCSLFLCCMFLFLHFPSLDLDRVCLFITRILSFTPNSVSLSVCRPLSLLLPPPSLSLSFPA